MGLFMSSVVLAGTYVIVSASHEFVIAGRKKIRLQQDFSLIRHLVATNVRQGIYEKLEIYTDYADYLASQPTQTSGSCIKLYFPTGDSILLYKDNSDLKIEHVAGTTMNLVPGVIDSLVFTEVSRSIETRLTMSNGSYSLADKLRHAFTNFVTTAYIDTLRPIGVGIWSDNARSGASDGYQCVDEVPSDDDVTYVYPAASLVWRTDTYMTEGGSANGTIDSVAFYIRARGLGSGNKTRTVVLLSGTRYYGSIVDLSDVGSYTIFSTVYTTNPSTSLPWTWSDIDAMEIGVRMYTSALLPPLIGSAPRCTQVWAEIHCNID